MPYEETEELEDLAPPPLRLREARSRPVRPSRSLLSQLLRPQRPRGTPLTQRLRVLLLMPLS